MRTPDHDHSVHDSASRGGAGIGLIAAALLASLLIVGSFLPTTLASAGGWFGRSHFGHGSHDAESAREHAEFAVGWVLRGVDATEEQRTRIAGIVGESLEDLHALAERHRTNREAIVEILGAPAIDRDRLEQVRADEMALADEASGRLTDSLADAAEILTPEQRRELIEVLERFRHH